MNAYSVHEESPPGNFTLLTECDSLDAVHAFAHRQPTRILRITYPDGSRSTIVVQAGELHEESHDVIEPGFKG